MSYSLKTRVAKIEKDCQPPMPSAVLVYFEGESIEEAVQRFREETGNDPRVVIRYWRKRPPSCQ